MKSMKLINTTLGAIPADQLGKVNVHEHVILDRTGNDTIPEDFHHVDVGLISDEVMDWKTAGGGAIVDSSPISAGRNVELLNEMSLQTQVPIIVSTGFHKLSYYTSDHWLHSTSEGEITNILISECMEGVLLNDHQPDQSRRSATKANMLKIGVDSNGFTPTQSKLLNAAAKTSNQLEIPMMIHTEPGVPFEDLIHELHRVNIDPGRVMICHMGKSLNFELHRTLANHGYFLEFDEVVRPNPPLPDLAKNILSLFEDGHGQSVLFAGDLARRGYWSCYGGQPGLAYLVSSLDEELRRLGFSEELLHQIWVENPRSLFSR